ncbi:MAG: hypothetical protein MR671_02695 [Clostridiales bacterium]|nr:hypothetical protein [Clostridiales bacterium]
MTAKKTSAKPQPVKKTAGPEMSITVDDGSERVPIKNTFGDEIGVFYFRPTDLRMLDRYNEVAGKFGEITAPLQQIGINADGTAEDPQQEEALHEAEKRLDEMVDYIFGGNAAEAFFGKMHPFSPINGVFYCENVLDALGDYIGARFDREADKVSDRVSQYTSEYETDQA